jgi:soluble lytic murein transglycosylase-like protein
MYLETLILSAAKLAKVSGPLLLAICVQESNLNPHAHLPVDGKTPTYGICQIKLETAGMIGFNGDAKELMKPEVNALWAGKYLKYRYDGDSCKAVAAYNAGTYNESKKVPGKPRNLKYVKNVQGKLEDRNKIMLVCDGSQK